MSDFQMDPNQFPIGPWTQPGMSWGGHNGPTPQKVLAISLNGLAYCQFYAVNDKGLNNWQTGIFLFIRQKVSQVSPDSLISPNKQKPFSNKLPISETNEF